MSLINPRNFIAPFSNKVAMGALVVGVIIVAVARISGAHSNRQAGLDRADGNGADEVQATQGDESKMNEEIRSFLEKQEAIDDVRAGLGSKKRAGDAGSRLPLEEDPFLAGLVEKEILPRKKAPPPPAQLRDDGLSDIKKTLGLE